MKLTKVTFIFSVIQLSIGILSTSYAADSCQIISNVCTEGPETRVINGISVYRECWNYEEKYQCDTGGYVDTCSGLNSSCTVTNEQCANTSISTGECLKIRKTYSCGQIQTDSSATLIDSSYTIVKDDIDISACQQLEDNSSCTESANICTQGPETRVIDGKEIYKECWAWEKQYTCASDTYTNYCEPLETICTQIDTSCQSYLANGECAIEKKSFDCATYEPEKNGVILIDQRLTISKDELDDSSCEDDRAECVLASKSCIEGAETRVIDGLPVYKDCWKYTEEYSCLSGDEVSTCDSIDTNSCTISQETCLLTDKNGICTSKVIAYECSHKTSDSSVISCGNQMFCMGDDCYDASYEPNNELGLAAAYLGTALKAGTELENITEIDIFTGHKSTCTQYPMNTVDCCDDSGWANGSVSGCDNEDLQLIEERKSKLTHYVGTYCSKKVGLVNVCVEYKQSYCTYGSMLARLFQEGARPQLNMSWGTAENPSCSGVTAEQLEQVDFTLIDFQEYIDEFQVTAINNEEIQQKVADKIAGMTQ